MKKLFVNLRRILSGERPLIDVWHYWVGNYRYRLYYYHRGGRTILKKGPDDQTVVWIPAKHFLMRRHIWEQISFRIKIMDWECYFQGTCKICGCTTTALQMASKSCDKPCYPPMMSKREWKYFKVGNCVVRKENCLWFISKYDGGLYRRPLREEKEELVYKNAIQYV